MNEQQTLVAMAQRLEAAGQIDDVSYPTESSPELSYHSSGGHGYWLTFKFDAAGAVVETSAGC
jgi:hypothetical protein